MNQNISNKAAFLTGGSRGIGRKIKEILESSGIQVISPTRMELDLAKPDCIQTYLDNNAALTPDIFIHCAGVNELAGIDEIQQSLLEHVFQINYYAPIMMLKHFSKHMKQQKWGRIIFISSLYALISKERRIAYSSSKNALTGLTKTLTLELAPYNILVNSVAPGYVMTEMTKKNLSESEIQEIESRIPTGRFQSEEDIAQLVSFLVSDFNQSITGQLIAVDGGFSCH